MTLLFSFSLSATAAEREFTLDLTQCAAPEVELKNSTALKVFSTPAMKITCERNSEGSRYTCSILQKKEKEFELLAKRDFLPDLRIGSTSQLASDDKLLRIFLNEDRMGAVYMAQEFLSQTQIRNLFCTGKIVVAPKEVPKSVTPPVRGKEIKPERYQAPMIGE